MSNVTNIKTGLPVVAGIEIAVDEQGRFNLNAIHRASSLGDHKKPAKWLRTDSALALAKELSNSEDVQFDVVSSVKGGKSPGTFAHELLAISYAGWISPAFQLKVNQVFMDYRTGNLAPVKVPGSLSEALRLAADLADQRALAEKQRDEAIATKALIGSKREATAMARASAESRRVSQLERKLGHEENWKQVKAIPWLAEEFVVSRTMYQQVGKKLKAISDEMGLEVEKIPSAEYGEVKCYRVEAINELWCQLQEGEGVLRKYRKGKAA